MAHGKCQNINGRQPRCQSLSFRKCACSKLEQPFDDNQRHWTFLGKPESNFRSLPDPYSSSFCLSQFISQHLKFHPVGTSNSPPRKTPSFRFLVSTIAQAPYMCTGVNNRSMFSLDTILNSIEQLHCLTYSFLLRQVLDV